MVVYIEYVLIENFVLDWLILTLALYAAKVAFSWLRTIAAALCGAGFALVFPLLPIPAFPAFFIKLFVGFLLCKIAAPKKLSRKNFFAVSAFFFCFSVAFAGLLLSISNAAIQKENSYLLNKFPFAFALASFAGFALICVRLLHALYRKRTLQRHLYLCTIVYKQKRVNVLAFLDSGNTATKNGEPVCFISPDAALDVWQEELLEDLAAKSTKGMGQACDEITISTLGGEKTLRLFRANLLIKTNQKNDCKKDVYFAISPHILSQEYQVLLHTCIVDEQTQI